MPLVLGGSAVVTPPYSIDNSCRFEGADSARLTSDFSGTGSSSAAIATLSMWVKLALFDSDGRSTMISAMDDVSNMFKVRFASDADGVNGSLSIYGESPALHLVSTMKLQDPSAWYHIVMAFDTAQSTDTNRVKAWINGVQITSWSTETYLAQDSELFLTKSNDLTIGDFNSTEYMKGYMAEFICIDGTAYTASDFGEYDSASPTIWKPKDPSGLTFGTKGYWLDFKDSAALGDDVSGNNNDFTEVNIAAIDQAIDSPTNNFATANPLASNAEGYAQGNLKVTDRASTDNSYGACSTIGVIKGKWYTEIKVTALGSAMFMGLLIGGGEMSIAGDYYASNGTMQYRSDGSYAVYPASSSVGLVTYTTGDIMSMAIDMDNLDLYYYKNGTIVNSGAAVFDSSDFTADTFYFPFQAGYNTGIAEYNFGGCGTYAVTSGNADANGYGNFEYAVPTGYYAICTKNLAEFGG